MLPKLNWTADDNQTLVLRLRPLREQWEARGPGLLATTRKRLSWLEYPPQLTILLVAPQQGGGRVCSADTVEFEAVLANPLAQLPETVRLAWLITQLAVENAWSQPVPNAVDLAQSQRVRRAVALVPYLIAAAEHVELASYSLDTIRLALQHWLPSRTSEETRVPPQHLFDWYSSEPVDNQAAWCQRVLEL